MYVNFIKIVSFYRMNNNKTRIESMQIGDKYKFAVEVKPLTGQFSLLSKLSKLGNDTGVNLEQELLSEQGFSIPAGTVCEVIEILRGEKKSAFVCEFTLNGTNYDLMSYNADILGPLQEGGKRKVRTRQNRTRQNRKRQNRRNTRTRQRRRN